MSQKSLQEVVKAYKKLTTKKFLDQAKPKPKQ